MRNETGLGLCILSSEKGFDGSKVFFFGLFEVDRGAPFSLMLSIVRVVTAPLSDGRDCLGLLDTGERRNAQPAEHEVWGGQNTRLKASVIRQECNAVGQQHISNLMNGCGMEAPE